MNEMMLSDGFFGDDIDDEANDASVIEGWKVKFTNDFQWVAHDEVIDPKREFLVYRICKVLQKWSPSRTPPLETRFFGLKEKMPDVEALNAQAPKTEWRDHFGELVGPFEYSKVVYLLHEDTMERHTYICPICPKETKGGHRAIRELVKAIELKRMVDGAPVLPIVTLADVHMPTAYGGRQRPHFQIVRFKVMGKQSKQIEGSESKQIGGASPSNGREPDAAPAEDREPDIPKRSAPPSKSGRAALAAAKAKLK